MSGIVCTVLRSPDGTRAADGGRLLCSARYHRRTDGDPAHCRAPEGRGVAQAALVGFLAVAGASRTEELHVQVPAAFGYERATSVGDALERLERLGPDARVIAGGHSLLPMMKLRLAAPEYLVDINDLRELDYICVKGDELPSTTAAAPRPVRGTGCCQHPHHRPASPVTHPPTRWESLTYASATSPREQPADREV
ncbi:MAG TPA: FAD binding domain-containing protein [Solirubrobacteraceae bacterium]